MTITSFAPAMRHAATLTRRGSLQAVGGAALAGFLAAPVAASAGNAGKKARKPCKRQKSQCLAANAKVCEATIDPQVCEASLNPCCAHFGRCNAGSGIVCLFS